MTRPVIHARLRLLLLIAAYSAWMFAAANVVTMVRVVGEWSILDRLVTLIAVAFFVGRGYLHARLPAIARSAQWYLASVISLAEAAAAAALLAGVVVGLRGNDLSVQISEVLLVALCVALPLLTAVCSRAKDGRFLTAPLDSGDGSGRTR